MKNLVIFGVTGSIGSSVVEIVKIFPQQFKIIGVSAKSNLEKLKKICEIFKPPYVVIEKEEDAKKLKKDLSYTPNILWGDEGLKEIASLPDFNIAIIGISGIKGLIPAYYALKSGKRVAIANKESIISAGKLLIETAKINKAELIPIDSEHCAFFQLLQKEKKQYVEKLILTASGGPFYKLPAKNFSQITPEMAISHPTWKMGKKISVDSATLMNKGFEVLEASILFDFPLDKIEVIIHPQSLIHAIIKLIDETYLLLLSHTDMKLPIFYALNYPKRAKFPLNVLDLTQIKKLTFKRPNFKKFPCLKLAYEVGKKGDPYPLILEAADEVVVDAFLNKEITFDKIFYFLEKTLNEFKIPSISLKDVQTILEVHKQVCEFVKNSIRKFKK